MARLGMLSDDLFDGSRYISRFDAEDGIGIAKTMSKTADKVLRASGLINWSDSVKHTTRLAFLAHLADIPMKYGDIDKATKSMLDRYKITEAEFKLIKEASVNETHLNVTKLPMDLNLKVRQLVDEESKYGVLEPGIWEKTILELGTNPGTWSGETVRMITQFKSFLIVAFSTHLGRLMGLDTPMDKVKYGVRLGAYGLAVGTMITAMDDLTKGIDPTSRDYDDPATYAKVLMRSGVFGVVGDTVLKDYKYGETPFDIMDLANSPVVSMARRAGIDIKNMVTEPNAENAGDVLRRIGKSLPGQNIWYSKMITNELGRAMMLLANPEYAKVFRKMDKRQEKRLKKEGLEQIDFFNK